MNRPMIRLSMKSFQLALALAAVSALSACSWFGIKSSTIPALEKLTPSMSAQKVWSHRQDDVDFSLFVTATAELFVTAGTDGRVQALKAANGDVAWHGDFGHKIAAGVGSDGRFAAAITRDNELVVLDGGKKIWSKALSSPVHTAPLVAGERVFVLTVDRQVLAFDAVDGRKLWVLKRPGEPLTLAETGGLGAFKNTLVVGQGPRLAGVDPLDGTLRWEANVANPRGANEVERLADVVGPVARSGDIMCARAFQAAVGCVNAERGSSAWIKTNAGSTGVSANADLLVGGDASDRITGWKLSNGDVAWTADQLQKRELSAPLVSGKTVVFGDGEGYVQFLSLETGKTLLRLPTDGSAVVAPPVAVNGTILIATRKGGLFAFRAD